MPSANFLQNGSVSLLRQNYLFPLQFLLSIQNLHSLNNTFPGEPISQEFSLCLKPLALNSPNYSFSTFNIVQHNVLLFLFSPQFISRSHSLSSSSGYGSVCKLVSLRLTYLRCKKPGSPSITTLCILVSSGALYAANLPQILSKYCGGYGLAEAQVKKTV